MPDLTKAVTVDPRMEGSDDSEDEDYNPEQTKIKSNNKPDNSDEDEDDSGREDQLGEYDSGDEKTIGAEISTTKKTKTKDVAKRNGQVVEEKEELGTDGGLIKTRAQRAQEIHDKQDNAIPTASTTHKTDIDALWAYLNNPSQTTSITSVAAASDEKKGPSTEEETITIQRTYEFAGELHTESKTVGKHSQEAIDYLSATKESGNTVPSNTHLNEAGKPLRRVIKRKSKLDDGSSSSKVQKINTLEKSRMEWSSFVDREGINEDLKRGNKAGYLDKQDFLENAERAKYNQWKAGQQK